VQKESRRDERVDCPSRRIFSTKQFSPRRVLSWIPNHHRRRSAVTAYPQEQNRQRAGSGEEVNAAVASYPVYGLTLG